MARGGYRKPMNPAPVSGPGSLSKRTDGGPSDPQAAQYISGLGYGQGKDFYETQVSGNEAIRSIEQTNLPTAGFVNSASSQPIIPLDAPTQRANEPVTFGADAGAGPGVSALGLFDADRVADDKYRAQVATYLPALLRIASMPTTSPTTRAIIRKLRDSV